MTQIHLDMFLAAGVGVLALATGHFLTRKVALLRRFCIPEPVSGGILFSLISLALYGCFRVEVVFDGTIKDLCMMIFFTSVGFQSDLRVLRQGGRPLVMLIVLVAVLIVCQNLLSVGIAAGMGLHPVIGMAAGSIPMSGGHGTAAGFGALFDSHGVPGTSSLALAAATFGLLTGSLIGGPLAKQLIERKKLAPVAPGKGIDVRPEAPETGGTDYHALFRACCQIVLAMALGALLNRLLACTGISFPTYFGALIAAALIRNLSPLVPRLPACEMKEIVSVGNVCLALFLGMAMMSLRLWELAGLALPLAVMLAAQALLILLYARFAAFPLLGKDYDAAVLVSGLCGFGLGATPNAMANMSAVCSRYHYAVKPFILVPVVGAMFADLINTTVITLFFHFI